MKLTRILEQSKILYKEYLSGEVETELREYLIFFTKPELIQPVSSPSRAEATRLMNLLMDLQEARERTVDMALDIRKSAARFKLLEKELLSNNKFYSQYKVLKNKEEREIFIYQKAKVLQLGKDRAELLKKMSKMILANIDRHIDTLKTNVYTLKSMISPRD
jgi:hypothetical protein